MWNKPQKKPQSIVSRGLEKKWIIELVPIKQWGTRGKSRAIWMMCTLLWINSKKIAEIDSFIRHAIMKRAFYAWQPVLNTKKTTWIVSDEESSQEIHHRNSEEKKRQNKVDFEMQLNHKSDTFQTIFGFISTIVCFIRAS